MASCKKCVRHYVSNSRCLEPDDHADCILPHALILPGTGPQACPGYARCSAEVWQGQCHSCHAAPGKVTKSMHRVRRTRSSTTARRRVDARSRVRPSGIPVSPRLNLERATLAGDDVCACQQSPRPALSSRMQQRCLRSGIIHSGGSAAYEQGMSALSGGYTQPMLLRYALGV